MRKTLLLLICLSSQAMAYDTRKTWLTEPRYDPILGNVSTFDPVNDGMYIRVAEASKYRYKTNDIAIATVTMHFDPDEIGQDYKTMLILVKKETQQLGGNLVLLVSATKYSVTDVIASVTFRCIRTQPLTH